MKYSLLEEVGFEEGLKGDSVETSLDTVGGLKRSKINLGIEYFDSVKEVGKQSADPPNNRPPGKVSGKGMQYLD